MNIKSSSVRIGRESIECGLWAIQRHLINKYGCTIAENDMAPIQWYVNTGRASGYFLSRLLACKPYMIARKLHAGGSYDEVLARVKDYMAEHTDYSDV